MTLNQCTSIWIKLTEQLKLWCLLSINWKLQDLFSINSDASSAVRGLIPAYDVLDVSFSYKYKFLKIETGVNNLLNSIYFTRRASGYPGPGIIPSLPINYYTTFQILL